MRNVNAVTCVVWLAWAAVAAGGGNSPEAPGSTPPESYFEHRGGESRSAIVVYCDDQLWNHYVEDALDNLGLAYDLFEGDYAGFEAAVATSTYDVIIVNHEAHFELSYAWDEIYNEIMDGKTAILSSFDWDGSNDLSSGYAALILQAAGHYPNYSLDASIDVYGWTHIPNPWWLGLPAVLTPAVSHYFDNGDVLWGDSSNSFAGAVPSFSENEVMMNYLPDCRLIVAAWCADEYAAADATQWWTNSILWAQSCVTGVPEGSIEETSWGTLKALHR